MKNYKTILALDLGTIKKHITDKGNATKYAVIDAVCVLVKYNNGKLL